MRAVVGSTRRPSAATAPSTRTRPSAMSVSQRRRDPYPARARTFCSRSPSGGGPSNWLALRQLTGERPRLLLPLEELGDGRQLVHGAQAEAVQEQLGRAEEHRLAGALGAALGLDVAALLQEAHHAVGV